jgi:predicted Ser/Thr protein kinase
MRSIEGLLRIKEKKEEFRSQIITRIAAWSLDHPKEKLNYQNLFPEISSAMRENFYSERNRLLTLVEQDILKYGTDEFDLLSAQEKEQVERALTNMKAKYGYCDSCARDVIAFVLRFRKDQDSGNESTERPGPRQRQKAGSGT